jgi:hypothetical protein
LYGDLHLLGENDVKEIERATGLYIYIIDSDSERDRERERGGFWKKEWCGDVVIVVK